MKKTIVMFFLFFITFNIFAMDNETFLAKVKEVAHCDTQAEQAFSDSSCNNKSKKLRALCMAQLDADRADLFCENMSKRSFQIQSYLYKKAAEASNDDNKYRSFIEKINQFEADRIKDVAKWFNDCADH